VKHAVHSATAWSYRHPAGRTASGTVGALSVGGALRLGGRADPMFWLGALGPDVALVYGRGRILRHQQLHPRAVRLYNALHSLPGPAVALAAGVLTRRRPLLVVGLAWLAHITVDRAQAYGLRGSDGYPWAYGYPPHDPSPAVPAPTEP
jgi:hypothetical protein